MTENAADLWKDGNQIKLFQSIKETQKKRKDDLKMKDYALENMQKLLDEAKEEANKHKHNYKLIEQELSSKRSYEDEIKELKTRNNFLSTNIEVHVKKSNERKMDKTRVCSRGCEADD